MFARPTRPATFRTTLVHTLSRNLLAAGIGLAGVALVSGTGATATTGQHFPEAGLDRVEALIMKHECWTGAAPAASPDPQHAVVTLPGGRPRMMSADVGYGIWLYHEPGVLHAFCA